MINNTIQNTYSSVLKPNPKAINPLVTSAQSALTNKIAGTPVSSTGFQGFGGGSSRGTGTTTTFPAPRPQVIQASTPGILSASGNIDLTNKNKGLQEQTGTSTAGTPVTTPTPTSPTNTGLVSTPQTNVYAGLVTRLQNAGSEAKVQQSQTADEIARLRADLQDKTGVIQSQPQELNFQTGRINALQTQEAAKESALQEKLSAQTVANNQNIGALGTAAGLAAPQAYGLTTQPYNPLTDTFGGGGANGALDRATQAGNISTAQSFAQDYNKGKSALTAADGIQKQIVATIQSNPTLNNTPLSALTNLNELLSGQVSSGPQQLLSQQIAQYINTLGLDPASVANIAHQQKGTLGDLLDSLRQTAETMNESKNPANLKNNGNTTTGSYTSSAGNKYNLPY